MTVRDFLRTTNMLKRSDEFLKYFIFKDNDRDLKNKILEVSRKELMDFMEYGDLSGGNKGDCLRRKIRNVIDSDIRGFKPYQPHIGGGGRSSHECTIVVY